MLSNFNLIKSYRIQKGLITNDTGIPNTPFNQHLQKHIQEFEPVLKELVKKDLDLFFAYPRKKIERTNYITSLAEDVCAKNEEASALLAKYTNVLQSMNSTIASDTYKNFQQNERTALFKQIDNITSHDDLPLDHLPSILNTLKPVFQKLAAKNVEIIFQAVQQFEKLALVLFEPILLVNVGITAFCSVILALHFKKGTFITLIAQLRSYTWAPYLSIAPLIKKTFSLHPIFYNPIVGPITIAGILGGVVFSSFPNNTSFANVIAGVRPPAKGSEEIQSFLTSVKALLEFTGAECFKVSTALMKGAITGFVDDNRSLLINFVKWLESSKKK